MPATTTPRTRVKRHLWSNTNGAIWCDQHGGAYLAAAVQARPTARRHTTPITTWERLTQADITELAFLIGQPVVCEQPGCTT